MGLSPVVAVMQGARSTRRSVHSANLAPPVRAAHRIVLGFQRHVFMAQVLARFSAFDRIFVYRLPMPAWAGRYLSRHKARIIFDFDDAIDRPEDEGALHALRARVLRRGLETAIRNCAVTVTSNQRNASVVRELGGRAVVVPTCVDLAAARCRDRETLGTPRAVIGWMGSPSTARYLCEIEEPLVRASSQRRMCIRLVGAGRNPFARLAVDVRPWSLDREADDICSFDVGLMPMPDTAWTRGKAALKALQYGAAGVPTVASWTDTNAEILGDGDGALLCRTADEWFAALSRVLDDAAFRAAHAERGRERVAERYSLDIMAPRLFRVITDAAGIDP
jgi:glycosyltransferase involved in cell wall biosynthesis